MDSAAHRQCTGVPNELILENVKRIHSELGLPIVARIPVVPGYNADLENIRATAKFIADNLGRQTPVNILAYHRLGEASTVVWKKKAAQRDTHPPLKKWPPSKRNGKLRLDGDHRRVENPPTITITFFHA